MAMNKKPQIVPKLVHSQIFLAGLGGAGYWVLYYTILYLRKLSVNLRIIVCDFDTIDESNLNRLPFPESYVGTYKAVKTEVNMRSLFSGCNIERSDGKISKSVRDLWVYVDSIENVLEMGEVSLTMNYTSKNIFIDATDNIKTQIFTHKYAGEKGMKYYKIGTTVDSFTITQSVSNWDTNMLNSIENQEPQRCGVSVPQSLMSSSMAGLQMAYIIYLNVVDDFVAGNNEKGYFVHRENLHEASKYNDYFDELEKFNKIQEKQLKIMENKLDKQNQINHIEVEDVKKE